MMSLARRLRRRFPSLLDRPYFPKRYPIISTQVARAAQSASAFALGFFQRAGANGGRPQPVAMSMLPKRRDAVLRFFQVCPAYLQHEDTVERWLAPWLWHHWESILPDVERRLGLPRGAAQPCDIDALWQLCSYEAGLLGALGGACSAFERPEAELLEWMEDVRLYETQGPGADINSRIAGVLLADLGASLRGAAQASAAGKEPLQLARLHFAHCETLTPLLTLLGLFKAQLSGRASAAAPGAPVVSPRQAQQEVGGVDSIVDDAALAVARRLAETRSGSSSGGANGDGLADAGSGGVGSSSLSDGGGGALDNGSETSVGSTDSWGLESHLGASSSSSSSSSSRSSSGGGGSSGGDGAGRLRHKHGPRAAGCAYKGRELAGGPLAPPPGWEPLPNDGGREWRGGRVAPLGGNLVVVLYQSDSRPARHVVRFVHNEQVLAPPFCGGGTDCDLGEFLEAVVDKGAASVGQLLELCEVDRRGAGPGQGRGAAGAAPVVTADGLQIELPSLS
ncbi:hypothetical protein MNEG_3694 [Monoraphidium neglectum]|uniref:Multiple inositol polyphosphate phosphatase 1 n=1 Tax=Monoraphidium neglectum TaxID=145388 RepID=A0A0D2K0W6_9CHLO|nr:hypothetical protein MNEG_3694 [Monoraphidium neglectum]KIZ04268.1 hypothetical protein MNEG_3694 [Monoraphidium neglectum]|eukprot:XP_013903287.1 hypothetical protein MNEG_3694 [Monoraphidium neglectum]